MGNHSLYQCHGDPQQLFAPGYGAGAFRLVRIQLLSDQYLPLRSGHTGYMYAQKGSDLFVNLFISSTADLTINDKQVQVIQQNNYPWDGGLKFTINTARPNTFRLHIRIPGWAQNQAIPSSLYVFMDTNPAKSALTINGEPVNYTVTNGYAVLDRAWKKATGSNSTCRWK